MQASRRERSTRRGEIGGARLIVRSFAAAGRNPRVSLLYAVIAGGSRTGNTRLSGARRIRSPGPTIQGVPR